jgi:hypothetical protein
MIELFPVFIALDAGTTKKYAKANFAVELPIE